MPPDLLRETASLLRRTQLLPGESLPSLLERLALLNHYTYATLLGRLGREGMAAPIKAAYLACPNQAAIFAFLADLTQLPPNDLWAASNHRFAPIFVSPHQAPPRMPWLGGADTPCMTATLAASRLRPHTAAQFCPLCLQTAPYHRLSWTPIAAALCLEHACLLVDRCPRCQRRLTIADIVRQHCWPCQADLSAAPAVLVTGDALGVLAQQAIQFWLTVASVPAPPTGYRLPDQAPAALYHLLEYLGRRLRTCQSAWASLPAPLAGLASYMTAPEHPSLGLTPAQAYHLYRAAFAGIVNWPHGLFQFLDAYSDATAPDSTPHLGGQRLAKIGHEWLQPVWRTPASIFILQGFVDYLLDRHLPLPQTLVSELQDVAWFQAQTGLWTAAQVAPTLGLSAQDLLRFYPNGPLGACLWAHSRAAEPRFERDKVLALHQRWCSGWSLADVRAWLGLAEPDVSQLVARGVLTIQPHATPDDTSSRDFDPAHWLFDRPAVERLFTAIASRLELYRECPHDLICLTETANALHELGIDAATLLQGILEGIIPAYKRRAEIRSLRDVCFVEPLLSDLRDRLFNHRGWVAGHRFAQEKGFSLRVVLDWLDAGLLQPHVSAGAHRYFDRQRLEQLAAEHLPLR